MVDQGRVARLLRGIADRVARLTAATDQLEDEQHGLWLDGVKYLLVTAIESCIDVAHHIASSESWSAPDTNARAIRSLGQHNVIEQALADRVARAVGFRNVLVHQYLEVDDSIVMDALTRLGDLREFVAQVSAWVLRQPSDKPLG